jgi:hypothetical protein
MSFKEAMALRVGGMDEYSRWHLQARVSAVGAAGVALIDAAFPGQAPEAIKARETALRWMVRGLVTHSWPFGRCRSTWRVQANRRPGRTT